MPGSLDDSISYGADGSPWTGPSKADQSQAYGVASMGFSILGGLLKGMSQIQAGNYNAATSRANAHLADLAAGDAVTRGQIAAAQALLRGSALESKQKAAYAGAGVAVGSGSAVDVQADTRGVSALDAARLANNAAREAWGYRTQASQLRQKAVIEEDTARNQAGDSILGGVQGAASYGAKMIGMV